jgi:transcription initiation factor IIE alpha subunit
MNDKYIGTRVAEYYRKLTEFHAIQSVVYRPSYRATPDKLWEAHEKINEWLRKEADELFCLGVSVYH